LNWSIGGERQGRLHRGPHKFLEQKGKKNLAKRPVKNEGKNTLEISKRMKSQKGTLENARKGEKQNTKM